MAEKYFKYDKTQKRLFLGYVASGMRLEDAALKTGIKYNTAKTILRNSKLNNESELADNRESVTVVKNDNDQVIDSKSTRIVTLEQLLTYCEVDLEVWEVERSIVNKWEVGVNNDGAIVTSPLIQVKAWLRKKVLEPVQLVISPVEITVIIPTRHVEPREKDEGNVALVISDPQFGFERSMRTGQLTPFHDRDAINIVFQMLQRYQFDDIILAGDWQDNSMFSDKFLQKPSYYFTTQPAIVESAWTCGMIRALQPTARIIMLEGNHDKRMEDAMIKHFVAGYGLRPADDISGDAVMSIQRLLGLRDLDIEYRGHYPEGEVWLNSNTVVKHGDVVRQGSGATVANVARSAMHTEIFGHIHRLEQAYKTVRYQDTMAYIKTVSTGCLCKIDGSVPGASYPNWQQGFVVVTYDDDMGSTEELVAIENGRATYRGEVFTAYSYEQTLIEETKFKDKKGRKCTWQF